MSRLLQKSYKLSELNGGTRFDCCAWHTRCGMGRKCVHLKDDPDYADLCTCYRREQEKLNDCDDCSDFMQFDENGQAFLI